jgi:hypothetical protein
MPELASGTREESLTNSHELTMAAARGARNLVGEQTGTLEWERALGRAGARGGRMVGRNG